ncbi:MAG: LytTR family DNA-binding domain-containing protein [Saprospiraceae bacterium]
MINAILIDDELPCIESLELDLLKYCIDINIIGKYISPKDGMNAIKKLKPDLVFLDIEMPWMNGFEMLELLQPINFDVIFVTAYDSYAVNAFKVNAIDYLMKPIDHEDLTKAVSKIKNKKESSGENIDRIQHMLEHYFQLKNSRKVILAEKDKQNFVEPGRIAYIQAESNYSKVFFDSGQPLLLSSTLKSIEDKLEGHGFARVHNSYLVNMDKVVQYVKSDGGYLVLSDNSIIPISRSKRNFLKSILTDDFI